MPLTYYYNQDDWEFTTQDWNDLVEDMDNDAVMTVGVLIAAPDKFATRVSDDNDCKLFDTMEEAVAANKKWREESDEIY